jgi:hypothetical protein
MEAARSCRFECGELDDLLSGHGRLHGARSGESEFGPFWAASGALE